MVKNLICSAIFVISYNKVALALIKDSYFRKGTNGLHLVFKYKILLTMKTVLQTGSFGHMIHRLKANCED